MPNKIEDMPDILDGEAQSFNQVNDYDAIILAQVKRCIDLLSKERRGYYSQARIESAIIPDIKEEIINSINAFYLLMMPYLKDKAKKEIQRIKAEDEQQFNVLLEQTIRTPKGVMKIKDAGIMPLNNPQVWDFKQSQVNRYEKIFEMLLGCYEEEQAIIRAHWEE